MFSELKISPGVGISILIGAVGSVYLIVQSHRFFSKLSQRRRSEVKKSDVECHICSENIDLENTVSFATCRGCERPVCRNEDKKCCEWISAIGIWECRNCHSNRAIQQKAGEWLLNQLTIRLQNPGPVDLKNDTLFGLDASDHEDGRSSASSISSHQKVKVREFIEELLSSMLNGPLDDVSVGQLMKNESYLPLCEGQKVPDSPSDKHFELRKLVQRVLDEITKLPELLNHSGLPLRPEEHLPYFSPKKYEQLLATAVLNKVVEDYRNPKNFENVGKQTEQLTVGAVPPTTSAVTVGSAPVKESTFDINHNKVPGTSSLNEANLRQMSLNTQETQPQEDLLQRSLSESDESYLSDYIQKHTVPLPDLSDTNGSGSGPEDDLVSLKSNVTEGTSWEENWLFRKRQLKTTESSIAMLVPSPTEEVKALIGDQIVDDISDLSEAASDVEDYDSDINNNESGDSNVTQHTETTLDEPVQDSLISINSIPSNEPTLSEAKNSLLLAEASPIELGTDLISIEHTSEKVEAANSTLLDQEISRLANNVDITTADAVETDDLKLLQERIQNAPKQRDNAGNVMYPIGVARAIDVDGQPTEYHRKEVPIDNEHTHNEHTNNEYTRHVKQPITVENTSISTNQHDSTPVDSPILSPYNRSSNVKTYPESISSILASTKLNSEDQIPTNQTALPQPLSPHPIALTITEIFERSVKTPLTSISEEEQDSNAVRAMHTDSTSEQKVETIYFDATPQHSSDHDNASQPDNIDCEKSNSKPKASEIQEMYDYQSNKTSEEKQDQNFSNLRDVSEMNNQEKEIIQNELHLEHINLHETTDETNLKPSAPSLLEEIIQFEHTNVESSTENQPSCVLINRAEEIQLYATDSLAIKSDEHLHSERKEEGEQNDKIASEKIILITELSNTTDQSLNIEQHVIQNDNQIITSNDLCTFDDSSFQTNEIEPTTLNISEKHSNSENKPTLDDSETSLIISEETFIDHKQDDSQDNLPKPSALQTNEAEVSIDDTFRTVFYTDNTTEVECGITPKTETPECKTDEISSSENLPSSDCPESNASIELEKDNSGSSSDQYRHEDKGLETVHLESNCWQNEMLMCSSESLEIANAPKPVNDSSVDSTIDAHEQTEKCLAHVTPHVENNFCYAYFNTIDDIENTTEPSSPEDTSTEAVAGSIDRVSSPEEQDLKNDLNSQNETLDKNARESTRTELTSNSISEIDTVLLSLDSDTSSVQSTPIAVVTQQMRQYCEELKGILHSRKPPDLTEHETFHESEVSENNDALQFFQEELSAVEDESLLPADKFESIAVDNQNVCNIDNVEEEISIAEDAGNLATENMEQLIVCDVIKVTPSAEEHAVQEAVTVEYTATVEPFATQINECEILPNTELNFNVVQHGNSDENSVHESEEVPNDDDLPPPPLSILEQIVEEQSINQLSVDTKHALLTTTSPEDNVLINNSTTNQASNTNTGLQQQTLNLISDTGEFLLGTDLSESSQLLELSTPATANDVETTNAENISSVDEKHALLTTTSPEEDVLINNSTTNLASNTNTGLQQQTLSLISDFGEILIGTDVSESSQLLELSTSATANEVETTDAENISSADENLIPGSIAERDILKWRNASPIANNPYSPDVLQKRLSESNRRSNLVDLDRLTNKDTDGPIENRPTSVSEETVADEKDRSMQSVLEGSPIQNQRYGRDYYINDAKRASGSRKQTAESHTQVSHSTDDEKSLLLSQQQESSNSSQRTSPVVSPSHRSNTNLQTGVFPFVKSSSCGNVIPTNKTEDIFSAGRPVQVAPTDPILKKGTKLEYLSTPAHEVYLIPANEPVTPHSLESSPEQSIPSRADESLTLSEDSDITRIYEIGTGETKLIQGDAIQNLKVPTSTPPPTPDEHLSAHIEVVSNESHNANVASSDCAFVSEEILEIIPQTSNPSLVDSNEVPQNITSPSPTIDRSPLLKPRYVQVKQLSPDTIKFFSPKKPFSNSTSNLTSSAAFSKSSTEIRELPINTSSHMHSSLHIDFPANRNVPSHEFIIEKEVMEVLPSVKELAKCYSGNNQETNTAFKPIIKPTDFIRQSSDMLHDDQEARSGMPQVPNKNRRMYSSTNSINAAEEIREIRRLNLEAYNRPSFVPMAPGHSITARSLSKQIREELKTNATDDCKVQGGHISPERPSSPVFAPGHLRNSIQFFENLKEK